MEEKDNVVQARFRKLTLLEDYNEVLSEIDPETIFSLVVKGDNVSIFYFGKESPEIIGRLYMHTDDAKNLLYEVMYGGNDE